MEEPSRRSFLIAALALAAGGCMRGFIRGGEEKVLSTPGEAPVADPAPEPPEMPLYEKDPVYSGEGDDFWMPDLDPVPRRVWAENAPIRGRLQRLGRPTRITVHHEGAETPNTHTGLSEVAADLRDIQRVHLRVMNAGDIGYHYVIDRSGRIWEGRSVVYQGAHAGGDANRANVGIMLLGNFDVQEPSKRQKKALRLFLQDRMERFGVHASRIYTHRELKPTRCPGDNLQRYMNAIRPRL